MILKRLIILSTLLIPLFSFGQDFKKENRIYMLDITKSIFGLGGSPNIYEEVKNALYKGIEDISDPETMVTIIPFQATHTYQILDSWTFKAGDVAKFNAAKTVIDSYTLTSVPGGYTDIYSAIETAKKQISNNRVNYIFLLTDGEQSAVPSSPNRINKVDFNTFQLINSLSNWCNYSKEKDVHLFYIMLTDVAVSQRIKKIVEEQCNAYVVEGTDINIAFIQPSTNTIHVNLNDNPEKLEINLSANNWSYIEANVSINLELEDNKIFELKTNTSEISNNKIIASLKRKGNASFETLRRNNPIESKLTLRLSTDSDVKILNPNINVNVKNKKERVLTLEFIDNE